MTEEPIESYDSGEVVWVKLGSSWWPGEVKNADELPSEVLDFKKPPLVIVKFFDEDSYEYVKTWTNIYPYNSEKKNEFIKKGMAAYRAKLPHMDKFPKDVLKAEEKVGGNPNILSNPMFLPEKKRNYAAEIFGMPSPKTSTPKNKKRSNKSSSKKDTSHITHRRFLGVDDYQAYICIQYPGKDRIPGDREDEEVIRINRELEQDFNCHSCSFSTKRLEVMILHTKSHIQGVYLAPSRKHKQTARRRKEKLRKPKGSDVVDSDTSSDSEPLRQRKRKPKAQGAKKTKIKKVEEEEVVPKKDIRSELLEAWEDSEDEDMDFTFGKTKESQEIPVDSSVTELPMDESKTSEALDHTVEPEQDDSTVTESVDDLLREPAEELKSPSQTIEEVLNDVSGESEKSTVPTEPIKPVEEQLSTEKLLSTLEDDLTDVEDRPVTRKKSGETAKVEKLGSEKKSEETVEEEEKFGGEETPVASEGGASKQKMDQEIHEAIKSCFDFDEDEEEDAIVGKAASGRKIPRVIPKASRKPSAEKADTPKDKIDDEDMTAAFKELMDVTSVPELPDVQNSLKCEQNFHNVKTIKFPDKPDSPPPRTEARDPTEVATKLTNPKKRFVKSFEDFELMQNEMRRREEKTAKTSTEDEGTSSPHDYLDNPDGQGSPPGSSIQLSKLKSKIMSKIIEEAKINTASKNKIMAKMLEPKPRSSIVKSQPKTTTAETVTGFTIGKLVAKTKEREPVSRWTTLEPVSTSTTMQPVSTSTTVESLTDVEPVRKLSITEPPTAETVEPAVKQSTNSLVKSKTERTVTGHRTPRSKILESYMKDTDNLNVEEKPEVSRVDGAQNRLFDAEPDKEAVPPKKKKWSRRGSHPKKDRNLFLLQEMESTVKPTVEEPVSENRTALINDDIEVIVDENEPKPSIPEFPVQEIVEEMETTKRVSEPAEPELTELMPVQMDDSYTAVDKEAVEESQLLIDEEVEVADIPLPPEVKVVQETVLADTNEIRHEEVVESAPQEIGENLPEEIVAPQELIKDAPQEIIEYPPEEIVEYPPQEIVEMSPQEIVEDPPQEIVEMSPQEIVEIPPQEIVEIPPQEIVKDSLGETVEIPPQEIVKDSSEETAKEEKIEEVPQKVEESTENPIEDENKSVTEELTIVAPPEPSSVVEESPAIVGLSENWLETAENSIIVPSNETVTAVTNQSDPDLLPVVEEQITVDNSLSVPQTVESDTVPLLDAVSASPKKSTKRKLSEDDGVELQPDSTPEKKVKEGGNTEEHLEIMETEVRVASEVTLECESVKDESQTVENDKKEVTQVEETKEVKGFEETNEEAELEKKELIVDAPVIDEKSETDLKKPDEKIPGLKSKTSEEVEKNVEEKADKETPRDVAIDEPDHNNEVEIQCASSSVDSFKFSIQTNLSILSSREEMSALALATLSEIKADLESNEEAKEDEEPKRAVVPPVLLESEMVPIEGNLTVVSEKDLADGQVEITSEKVINPKRPVTLSNFSMDFSDSFSDSNSNSTTDTDVGKVDFNSKGTEFTAKALTRQMKRVDQKKEIRYGRLELINILEGNSDAPKKPSAVEDICDFEEHIPSQIVCAKNLKKDVAADLEWDRKEFKEKEKTSKTSVKSTTSKLLERLTTESKAKAKAVDPEPRIQTVTPKTIKYPPKSKLGANKPIILSEQIVKPPAESSKKLKRSMEDFEDVETFVIHKDPVKEEETKRTISKTHGKAKILQQTIITPAGEIIQPTVTDDNIFDINSMPIVLSDEILTPESIEKMPIVIGGEAKATVPVKKPLNKTVPITKHKPPRILQSFKTSPLLPNATKPGKYIIVPQSSIPPTKYLGKKPTIVKKPPAPVQKAPSIAAEPSGNKIMIVTNQQGQQQRLLLTPAQQKMLGYQNQKVAKTVVKGNVIQKSVLASKGAGDAGTSGIMTKTAGILGQKVVVGTTTSAQRTTKTVTKRAPVSLQKPQKTILIKNQHGQTVRKIQGTDDELLDKQVAEQLKAIKASSGMKFGLQQQKPSDAAALKSRRSYSKRAEVKPRGPPPLSSIKQETVVSGTARKVERSEAQPAERPLNQLVIQDAVGNQTTITEGQILALPSETVDGQPQSYMLVTLDESGNLTPLNSEALMSLDPNLGLGGDLSNMVLQFDQSATTDQPQAVVVKPPEVTEPVKVETAPQPVPVTVPVTEQKVLPAAEPVPTSTNGDSGQQLIVTGDPIATQKFLESLTEGTTDLANILANAEGNSILIQADGQQILINTNADNQMLLSMNNDGASVTEGGGNPIFATQPSKNQDILAAALADTDVFQQEHQSGAPSKIGSQLSPNNTLYPMNVGNVLETSLTLSSPIMTPLEVPSTNNKKIPDDETDILTQVPKNVDLPITITDPNISQTVANQQVSQMIANELQTNLELALPISETTISATSAEMNVYSLPTLEDPAQKPFNGSMPLLTEDVVEEEPKEPKEKVELSSDGFLAVEEGRFTLGGEMCSSLSEPPPEMFDLPETFGEKTTSLQSTPDVSDNASKDGDATDLSQAETSSEGSCEIPLQPQIVTKSLDLSGNLDSLKRGLGETEGGSKRCKFD